MLRLHLPLIEPDVRVSRIRLSDQVLPQGIRTEHESKVLAWLKDTMWNAALDFYNTHLDKP